MMNYLYREVLIILSFSLTSSYLIRKFADLPRFSWWLIGLFVFISLIFLKVLKRGSPDAGKFIFPFSTIPLLCFVFYIWFENVFGKFDLGSILFHLEMGVENAATKGILENSFRYAVIFLILLYCLSYLIRRDRRLLYMDRLMAVPIFCMTPFFSYIVDTVLSNDSVKLIHYYKDSAETVGTLKASPKNIVLIYAESAERTFGEIAEGKNAFAEMMNIASLGMSIKGIKQAANTGWTIAGIVASQCGVPLQPLGLLSRNKFGVQEHFLPGVTCFAELLKSNGYHTQFINGGSLAFAGKGKFLQQHGYDVVEGLEHYEDTVSGYVNHWGLYDDTVFNLAESQIESLSKAEKPFLYTILTNSGHFPEGYPSKTCIDNLANDESHNILFSIKCTGYHIDRFLNTLRDNGLLKDAMVIITSDHLVMKNTVTEQLNAQSRMNYFTVLDENKPATLIQKTGAMFDVFPTMLELVGFEVSGSRAGIGVSLLSDKPTLMEQMGQETLDNIIQRDRALSRKIWSPLKG